MLDEKDLEAIAKLLEPVNNHLSKIDERLDSLEEKVDEIKEDGEITREAVNKVADWADNAGFLLKIPFGKPVK